jgi:hypothetical protein
MKKFSDKYDGLFACTLGGETHIWVARDDVAEDLLCNNAAISSARADLGVYPDVTKGFRYLPLLGYTGEYNDMSGYAIELTQSQRGVPSSTQVRPHGDDT